MAVVPGHRSWGAHPVDVDASATRRARGARAVTAKVVEGYLHAVATQDWHGMRASVRDDVIRIGPFGDTYTGRDAYIEFLAKVMPTLAGYSMDVARVTYVDGGRRAIAELSETVTVDGASLVTREVLLFAPAAAGGIARVEIFPRRV